MRYATIVECGASELVREQGVARRETIPGSIAPRAATRRNSALLSELRRRTAEASARGRVNNKTDATNEEIVFPLDGVAVCGRRSVPIRKKVIGHGMSFLRANGPGDSGLRLARNAFTLAYEPLREHRASIFFKPLVEQRPNFLAKIGGVAHSRQLIALERIPRSRKQKLPRRLRLGTGHVDLLQG